jgi:hypothetical protein
VPLHQARVVALSPQLVGDELTERLEGTRRRPLILRDRDVDRRGRVVVAVAGNPIVAMPEVRVGVAEDIDGVLPDAEVVHDAAASVSVETALADVVAGVGGVDVRRMTASARDSGIATRIPIIMNDYALRLLLGAGVRGGGVAKKITPKIDCLVGHDLPPDPTVACDLATAPVHHEVLVTLAPAEPCSAGFRQNLSAPGVCGL